MVVNSIAVRAGKPLFLPHKLHIDNSNAAFLNNENNALAQQAFVIT